MRAAFTGLVGLFFKDMAEKPGMHLGDGKLVDLFEVFDICQFFVVKRETVKTIPLGVDVHGAVVCTSKIKILVVPFGNVGNRLAPMVEKPLYEGVFIFLNIIHKAGRE